MNDEMARLVDYPGLAQLRLDDSDFEALAMRGFVRAEQHRNEARSKLRFRTNSRRQRVRCIPPHLVELVRTDLERLQSSRRANRELRDTTRCVLEARRHTKSQLAPMLAKLGYRWHGNAIRQGRHNQITIPMNV